MYRLPTEVVIDENTILPIRNKGDFRIVLDCFEILNDTELDDQERLLTALIVFYDNMNSVDDLFLIPDLKKAVTEMKSFFNAGEDYENVKDKPKLIDWSTDSNLIFAAVNNVAGKELRSEEYIHWWTFLGYYMSITESSLTTVVNIRGKIAKGKKLESFEKEFRRDNPKYFVWDSKTNKQKEADELAKQLWNSNG